MKMAPFPDEVDVFTGPHWRMKQLVGLYCEKVRVKKKQMSVGGSEFDRGACDGPRPSESGR